jgi:hypothetical protein
MASLSPPARPVKAVLRHATPQKNLASIRRSGLLTRYAKGKLPVVWFHRRSRTPWAVLHTVKRHGGGVEQVVVLEVQVPRSWLRRSRKGLWCCYRDIPPERIRGVLCFAELAGSSVEE